MPEPEGNFPTDYVSPWRDFWDMQNVRTVKGENGNPTLETKTPCGWIFHLAAMRYEHPVPEEEVMRFAEELNGRLEKGTRFHPEGGCL